MAPQQSTHSLPREIEAVLMPGSEDLRPAWLSSHPPMGIRANVIGVLRTFASPSEQQSYQAAVSIVSVPTELGCQWADDLYHPGAPGFQEAFSLDELAALATFDSVFRSACTSLPESISVEEFIAS